MSRYSGLKSYMKNHKKIKYKKIFKIIFVLSTVCILFYNIKDKNKENIVSNTSKKKIYKEEKEKVDSNLYKTSSNLNIDTEKENFIKTILNEANNNYKSYGILPSITIAQAILESGWGSSNLAVTHNNLFGIKADSRWSGAVATISTSENYNDKVVANFRKYDNINDSVKDHGKFLYENARYTEHGLFNSKDYKKQAQALEEAGYSTAKDENGDLIYADKLIALIEKYNLMQYD